MSMLDADALFCLAAEGDEDAYYKLFDECKMIGYKTANDYISSLKLFNINMEEFETVIQECFVTIINSYDPKTSRFRKFSKLVLERRMKRRIIEILRKNNLPEISLDDYDCDKRSVIETIGDADAIPIPDQIALEDFKAYISSPKVKVRDKNRSKINSLVMQGYSLNEISKKLGLGIGYIRYLIKENQKDDEIQKMKLDLK